ncbi:TPA: PrgI family protein [Salmonella enterica subsp. enterica serovar Typhi str. AG3]|nr:PrgI family protein [Salmonella enterica subsp. enterica serovar Typhi str. AG3]
MSLVFQKEDISVIRIPIDLTEEQKTVLAYFSIRQLLIVFPALVLTLIQLIMFKYPFISGWGEFALKMFIFILVNGISVCLAFIKLEKYDCYLSEFVVRRIKFWRTKKIYTN